MLQLRIEGGIAIGQWSQVEGAGGGGGGGGGVVFVPLVFHAE